jgi:transcriptional regulator with XRE-family HTH domain
MLMSRLREEIGGQMTKKNIGKRFRELRALTDLTQHQAASQSHIERSRLSLFENGHVQLAAGELVSLQHILSTALANRVLTLQEALSILRAGEVSQEDSHLQGQHCAVQSEPRS